MSGGSKPGDAHGVDCGLFISAQEARALPLKRREVRATVYCDAGFADTSEELHYVSDVDCSVVFKFPLPPRAAIYRCAST